MQIEHLKVKGMTCGFCTNLVSNALKAINGVNEVAVSLLDCRARVQYDERLTSPEQLELAVKQAGYEVVAFHTIYTSNEC
ncbi:MAG TPA: heavy-metal-associated domain-containing protein [Methylotenera sp.]|nr:heavy-metal-associated domain-containing protein [Methylotenera sp.]